MNIFCYGTTKQSENYSQGFLLFFNIIANKTIPVELQVLLVVMARNTLYNAFSEHRDDKGVAPKKTIVDGNGTEVNEVETRGKI